METIYSYLRGLGFDVQDRDEKHTAMFILESDKLNTKQLTQLNKGCVMMGEKLDGVFSFIVVYGNKATHFGRSGKRQQNTEALDAKIERAMKDHYVPSGIYISEVTSDEPLAVLSGYLTPTRVEDAVVIPRNIQDNLYDYLTIDGFIKGFHGQEFRARHEYICAIAKGLGINSIEHTIYPSYADAVKVCRELIAQGKEGGVIKLMYGTWEAGKRDARQVKVKEKLEFDVRVIGMCSGKKGTKYENTLGKLLVHFKAHGTPDGEPLVIPISGMSDAQREIWWHYPELIVGKLVKMAAKSFTEPGNLREPRFKEIREDKNTADFPCFVTYYSRVPDVIYKSGVVKKVWPYSFN